MPSHVGSEDLQGRHRVPTGVAADALESVDRPDPELQLRDRDTISVLLGRAELSDRLIEPGGDLALLGHPRVRRGLIEGHKDERSSEDLCKRLAGLLQGTESVLRLEIFRCGDLVSRYE